jgi:hypothetical protein
VPEFLSEMWLRELDLAVRASGGVCALAPIVIEQVVIGVPGRGEVRYRFQVDGDGARVTTGRTGSPDAQGAPGAPDVRMTVDYDTAVAISVGKENAQIALARGRLRLGGNVESLVRRAATLSALDDATATLRADTTYPSP